MKKRRRVLSVLTAVLLVLALSVPMPASAANLYFTALNDTVVPLTADTMPVWYNGLIYVPYTVFDANLNGVGVNMGMYTSYNSANRTVTLFNLRQMLVFDLNTGTCRDDVTGTTYSSRAMMRNGRPYLSLSMVCSYFSLEYSYHQLSYIPQGYLVRIRSADVAIKDDAYFIDAAQRLISDRLRDYTQSLSPAETTDPVIAQPSAPPEVPSSKVATYLAFRCEDAGSLPAILNTLDSAKRYAVFFLSPQLMEEEGGLVRRILGTGHSVGILANGEGDVQSLLDRGQRALEEAAQTRTTLAYVPAGQRAALEQEGWVCWAETMLLRPGSTVGANTFAANTLDRLGTRRRTVFLTMEGDGDAARVLSALLRQMDSGSYSVAVPMETRL